MVVFLGLESGAESTALLPPSESAYRLVISVLHPLSSRNTRSLALNPDIRPFQSFLFCATSGTLLFTGMKRLFLPAVSCFLKKTPDSINTDRQIQRFNDFQTCDIRLFFQKRKDVLMICIGQFWLLSTEIRLSFVAACFVPTLQQTIDRTGVYRKALCQFFYANAFVVSFQNQLSSFVVQHSTHLLCLCYTSFCSKVKVLCCIIENCYRN